MMEVKRTFMEGLLIIQPMLFSDERGYFFESYNIEQFRTIGIDVDFMQDNESCSSKGVLRGLHFQKPPYAQGKLVRVIAGRVMDVVVDIRKNSSTYGQYFSIELSGHNKTIFWIPPGFAHGFIALEENTIFSYKCTNVYHKESEQCLLWNDSEFNIKWPLIDILISPKDREGLAFNQFESPF